MSRAARLPVTALALCIAFAGCSDEHSSVAPPPPPPIPGPVMERFVLAYEQKKPAQYQAVFTGDFTFEFSNATDPLLVQQYSTGWFKNDEKESSNHLFNGYTPPGGMQLPAATTIDIHLASDIPTDDNTSIDPRTHKVLLTRVDGSITVPQSGSPPLTYEITNNLNQFFLVRGDLADSLESTQPADSLHWYIYRWVDLSETTPGNRPATQTKTWAALKANYR